MQKPGLPEGTRDFGPDQVRKRTYIFDTIRAAFIRFGFQPLETPAMENLSTLTGKYGEEGDKLLFKILNNGDFLKEADSTALAAADSARVLPDISKRGLRYDLTVPFARYVVMNKGQLVFPFKRYQIQPVWRADRPQRGRYREFYQCDADVIGSESLIYEAELLQIYDQVFQQLQLPVVLKINHRKVLQGIAEAAGVADRFMEMTIAVDKLDKIGVEGVRKELLERNMAETSVEVIEKILATPTLEGIRPVLSESEAGRQGLAEIDTVLSYLSETTLFNELRFDVTLARGLTYYTGCIFEIGALTVAMGSLGGGGRYADLTGVFGAPGLSGVGISFGADRIYDCLETLNLFPESLGQSVQVLFTAFDEATHRYAFKCASQLRSQGIAVEVYPEPGKLKKQFEYASKRNIPYVALCGETEMQTGMLTVKNQQSGEQQTLSVVELQALFTGA